MADDGEDGFDVRTGSYFGDDATVGSVDVYLGNDDIGKDFDAVFYDGGGGFVAAGFDAEDFHDLKYSITCN